ncbi:MAG: response regulator [Fibrobacterota bacterium]
MEYRILLVDDEEEIRQMLSRHFRFRGFAINCAATVAEAQDYLNENIYHIVISDIVMPGANGTELLSFLKDDFPMIRSIMVTGYISLENALTCMRRGADTCIFKPLNDLSELDDAVERAVEWHKRWQEKLHFLRNNRR